MKSYLGTAFTIYDYANKIELQFDDNIIYSAAYDEIFDDKTLLPDLPFLLAIILLANAFVYGMQDYVKNTYR